MTANERESARMLAERLLGPLGPELSCEECFDMLDVYVESELAGGATGVDRETDVDRKADVAMPGMSAIPGMPAVPPLADGEAGAATSAIPDMSAVPDMSAMLAMRAHLAGCSACREDHDSLLALLRNGF